jgi:Tfp pilus assembly protein PilV
VLVTVVILNIGILTAARLLNESLQSLGDNRYQQRAVRLGADLAELLSHTSVAYAAHVTSPANHGCERSICNPQQFVEHSLQMWHARATQLLPDGRGSVELQTAGDQTIAHITLLWTPRGAQSVRHHTQATLLPDA